jgi:hypothetical protein
LQAGFTYYKERRKTKREVNEALRGGGGKELNKKATKKYEPLPVYSLYCE